MTIKTRRTLRVNIVRSAEDEELLEQLDQLVAAATAGDAMAVGAIAIAFGPELLLEARYELGTMFEHVAPDVLQEFLLTLLTGRLKCPPIRGTALPWMKRTVRAFARCFLGAPTLAS